MLYLTGAAVVCAVILGAVTVAAGRFSSSRRLVLFCGKALAAVSALGLCVGIVCISLFFVIAAQSDDSGAVRDAFSLFAITDSVFVLICLAITFTASVTNHKMTTVRWVLSSLWAVLSLMWTSVCILWSQYDDLDASVFIGIFGVSLAALLSVSGALDMFRLAKALSTEEGVLERKKELSARYDKRRRRKSINSKRKMLSRKH